jgi:hypothetical protein
MVRSNNLHGTDYSGNIGRADDPHTREASKRLIAQNILEAEKIYPHSFRPYLTRSLLQRYEPQALYRGLVSPDMILRVKYRYNEQGWMTRKQFIAYYKDQAKDMDFDLSSTRHTADEYIAYMASELGGRRGDKKTIIETLHNVLQWEEEGRGYSFSEEVGRFGIGEAASASFRKKFIKKYGKKNPALSRDLASRVNLISRFDKEPDFDDDKINASVHLYIDGKEEGELYLRLSNPAEVFEECRDDLVYIVDQLVQRGVTRIRLYEVMWSDIYKDAFHGLGLGEYLYEGGLRLSEGFGETVILVSDTCGRDGVEDYFDATSPAAMRVYKTLQRRYIGKGLMVSSVLKEEG